MLGAADKRKDILALSTTDVERLPMNEGAPKVRRMEKQLRQEKAKRLAGLVPDQHHEAVETRKSPRNSKESEDERAKRGSFVHFVCLIMFFMYFKNGWLLYIFEHFWFFSFFSIYSRNLYEQFV
jgi:hypothetical protein